MFKKKYCIKLNIIKKKAYIYVIKSINLIPNNKRIIYYNFQLLNKI
jgi:hypothetical protein